MTRRQSLLSSSAGTLALAAAVAATTLPAAPARAAVGPGWKPSAPLWETAQVQTNTDETPTTATASQDGQRDGTMSVGLGGESGSLEPSSIRSERQEGLRATDEIIPTQQLRNLPRPYTPPAVPPTEEGEPRASVVAEELSYDETEAVITASGDVELVYDGRVLRADVVRYDTRADRVTAEGNVTLAEPDGNVYFFDYTELTGDMKAGFAREATLLLADRSRAVGTTMTRENRVSTLERAIYTACDPCEDPDAAPLWRLRARRVTHDEGRPDRLLP